ncbi:MAG: hypothetical protein Q8S55_07590 [Methylococcaceae bacterium]|nr:hypothetical protein [Methylococcaceae bacterium]
MRNERRANAEFIILAHNMMPEILADLERLQLLEAELDRVKDQAIEIETALESSIEAMSLMREQIEQIRACSMTMMSLFNWLVTRMIRLRN